jgi:hypothetical protein
MNIAVKKPGEVQAWRIEFSRRRQKDRAPLLREPHMVWVQAHEQNLRAALLEKTPTDGLVVIFVPSGAATPRALQRPLQQWMDAREGEQDASLAVHTTSGRFLWRRGRAMCFGLPDAMQEALVGLIRFSYCELELDNVENEVEDCWVQFEMDIDLMQRMTSRLLRDQWHIEKMAMKATKLRARYLKLLTALEVPKSSLPGADRRLFLELALQADAADRLRMLDDTIEVFEEFYRHQREQFAEYRYFRAEFLVEVLILIALVVQLIAPDQPLMVAFVKLSSWLTPLVTAFVHRTEEMPRLVVGLIGK